MRPILLTVLASAALLTSCGGSHHAAPRPTVACSVHVYFAGDATRSQERLVGSKLRHDGQIWRVAFVSKAQALREMKKKFPGIVKASPLKTNNPLPDSFVATPLDPTKASEIGHSFDRARWPGVATVKWPQLLARARCGS